MNMYLIEPYKKPGMWQNICEAAFVWFKNANINPHYVINILVKQQLMDHQNL